MSHRNEDAAYTELEPDAWHQSDEGTVYIDCPECGSAATVMNVVTHGRCNGYLDEREDDTELDEAAFECTAKLWFELGYVSDSDESTADRSEDAERGGVVSVEADQGGTSNREGRRGEKPPETDGTVDG